MVLVDSQSERNSVTLQQNLHAQVLQLQQKQQLWLQSQYYLLNTLAESPAGEQAHQMSRYSGCRKPRSPAAAQLKAL